MAKEVAGLIQLQIKDGSANPSPPVEQHNWPTRCKYHGILQGFNVVLKTVEKAYSCQL